MAKQYKVGENSRKFLDALDVFAQFRNAFITALTETYGDDMADNFYSEYAEKLDDVERIIMDYLRVLFLEEMGTGKEIITI